MDPLSDVLSLLKRRSYMSGGGEFLSLGGYCTLAGDHTGLLLGILPPVLQIRGETSKAVLRWCVDHMRESIAAVAQALGYASESAFSMAFKRVMGAAPRRHAPRGASEPLAL